MAKSEQFHLYEVPRIGKFIKLSRIEFTRGRGEEEGEWGVFSGWFQFGMMKSSGNGHWS